MTVTLGMPTYLTRPPDQPAPTLTTPQPVTNLDELIDGTAACSCEAGDDNPH